MARQLKSLVINDLAFKSLAYKFLPFDKIFLLGYMLTLKGNISLQHAHFRVIYGILVGVFKRITS